MNTQLSELWLKTHHRALSGWVEGIVYAPCQLPEGEVGHPFSIPTWGVGVGIGAEQ